MLEIYKTPLTDAPHNIVKTSQNKDVPLWFLDQDNLIRSIDFPPMSQNISEFDKNMYILFESGASKYQFMGKGPIDYILKLNLKELDL